MTKQEAFDRFKEAVLAFRCGDNSCIYGRFAVGTNGGCQTIKDPVRPRRELAYLMHYWRTLVEQVES